MRKRFIVVVFLAVFCTATQAFGQSVKPGVYAWNPLPKKYCYTFDQIVAQKCDRFIIFCPGSLEVGYDKDGIAYGRIGLDKLDRKFRANYSYASRNTGSLRGEAIMAQHPKRTTRWSVWNRARGYYSCGSGGEFTAKMLPGENLIEALVSENGKLINKAKLYLMVGDKVVKTESWREFDIKRGKKTMLDAATRGKRAKVVFEVADGKNGEVKRDTVIDGKIIKTGVGVTAGWAQTKTKAIEVEVDSNGRDLIVPTTQGMKIHEVTRTYLASPNGQGKRIDKVKVKKGAFFYPDLLPEDGKGVYKQK